MSRDITSPATKFLSEIDMWAARDQFAAFFKEEMDQFVRDGEKTFGRTMDLGYPVGEGIEWVEGLSTYQAVEIHEISHVTFHFFYEDGKWYELTGYPDATVGD